MTRTDIHRPSVVDPANYSYSTSFDNNPPELHPPMGVVTPEWHEYMESLMAPWREERDRLHGMLKNDTSVYNSTYRCDHCGAHLRYVSLFYYEPTGEHIAVGEECAENTFSVPDRMSLEIKRLRDAASNRREKARYAKECEKARNASIQEYPDAVKVLDNYKGNNSFIHDVKDRFDRYGNLSERQAYAVVRAFEKEVTERSSEPVGSPVVEGKIIVMGEVKRAYHKETPYGSRFVMIVEDDRGFRLWGSVPRAVSGVEEGDRVEFSANVEKSDRDETFGFYKRPTKASILQ